MTRPMPPAVRVAGELTPAVVASMCTDAAALAALYYDAMAASTPPDPRWGLCAAVLLDQFARLGGQVPGV